MSIDMTSPLGHEWRVKAWQQPDQQTAGQRYEAFVETALLASDGDVSIYRTTVPDRSKWLLVVVGNVEKVADVELEGEPYELTPDEAAMFCQRRFRTGLEAVAAGETTRFTQLQHYSGGALIEPDGSMRPFEV